MLETQGRLGFQGADPSVIQVGETYYAVDSYGNNIYVRSASSVDGLGSAARRVVWTNGSGNIWAPELVRDPSPGVFTSTSLPARTRKSGCTLSSRRTEHMATKRGWPFWTTSRP